jgi:hypothetical protein
MSEGNERPRRGGTARLSENGEAPPRRTERLDPSGDEWSQREPVNPGWRSERATGARGGRKGRAGLPASPQEFQLWLQAGGWRYVAGIAGLLIVLLIALLAYGRSGQRETGLTTEQDLAATSVLSADSGATPLDQPTITIAQPTLPPAPTFFTITGTSGQGLFLRPDPSTSGAPITTLPDGTRVEQIGEDAQGGDITWRKVRTEQGQEGWVAVQFLAPAP